VRFVVLTVKVAVTAPVALGVTVAGEAVQVARLGKPAQARVTGEVNPETELTLTVTFAGFPATTVAEVGLMDTPKFAPPPVREITCGLLLALSIKVTAPIALPAAVGVYVTLMAQEPPAATCTPQVLVCPKGPVTEIEAILSAAEPVLVTATVCGALVVFTAWEPKLRLVGETDTMGWADPVPVSRMIWGLLGALSVRVSDPTLDPAMVGVKVTAMVQFELGVVAWSPAVQLLLCTAKSPVIAALVKVRGAVPVLVTVRVRGALVTPTACWTLKAKVDEDRLRIGAVPAVPVKSTT
jgi:hypothetical protein